MGDNCPEPGRVLVGKYRLEQRLGEGGFGSIWRAEHLILKAPVAVKIIDPDVAQRDGALDRFLREAQATATLRSPHVVQILDYGIDQELAFIVMELLEGENLAERMRRAPLSAREIVRIVTQVGRAIDRAHEAGIVHRDLKPENVFLVKNGDDEMVKILDFGVAKTKSSMGELPSSCTQTGSLIGTPYYMSPEQAQGNKTVDHRTDLWALGVMVFEMFTSRRPFDSEALGDLVLSICIRPIPVPSTLRPELPPRFDAWFAHATARNPEARFQSARELTSALIDALGEEPDVHSLLEEPLALEQKNGARLPQAVLDGETPILEVAPFAATVLDEDPRLRDEAASAALRSRPRAEVPTPAPSSQPGTTVGDLGLATAPPRGVAARRRVESERRIFGEFWLGVALVTLLAVLVVTMLLSRRAREWWRGTSGTIEPVPTSSTTRPLPRRERTEPRAAATNAPSASVGAEPNPPPQSASRPPSAEESGNGPSSGPQPSHAATPSTSSFTPSADPAAVASVPAAPGASTAPTLPGGPEPSAGPPTTPLAEGSEEAAPDPTATHLPVEPAVVAPEGSARASDTEASSPPSAGEPIAPPLTPTDASPGL